MIACLDPLREFVGVENPPGVPGPSLTQIFSDLAPGGLRGFISSLMAGPGGLHVARNLPFWMVCCAGAQELSSLGCVFGKVAANAEFYEETEPTVPLEVFVAVAKAQEMPTSHMYLHNNQVCIGHNSPLTPEEATTVVFPGYDKTAVLCAYRQAQTQGQSTRLCTSQGTVDDLLRRDAGVQLADLRAACPTFDTLAPQTQLTLFAAARDLGTQEALALSPRDWHALAKGPEEVSVANRLIVTQIPALRMQDKHIDPDSNPDRRVILFFRHLPLPLSPMSNIRIAA